MGFHIIVCLKSVIMHVPDKATDRSPDSCELNPFDRPALEVALRMKEKYGGIVTALSMGPENCTFALYEAMAMGVDHSVLVCDSAFAGADTLATSTTLAAAIKKLAPFDLVLFGTRTADSDTGQVGPQTAVLLDLPLVTGVHSIENHGPIIRVERSMDAFRERYEISLPAALTIHPNMTQPRDVGLIGIEVAFEDKEVKKWNLLDLGLSSDRVGEAGSSTRVNSVSRVDRERKCEILTGTAEDQTEELIRRLADSGLIG